MCFLLWLINDEEEREYGMDRDHPFSAYAEFSKKNLHFLPPDTLTYVIRG